MNGTRSDPVQKIALEEALKSITETIVATAEASGVDAESLNLEMQFSLEVKGDKIEPVVYAGEVPHGVALHRLSFRVGVHCIDTESERVRRELEALTSDYSRDSDGDTVELDIDDQPPGDLVRPDPDGVLVKKSKKESSKTEGPRIIVPAKPVLKLRHASEQKKQKDKSSDEQQARHFERDYSIPEAQKKYDEPSDEIRAMANPTARFVIFDHQRVQGRLTKDEEDKEDDLVPDIEA